jgi:oxygen-independent coproporphyrinogen-3 oxidase
LGKNTWALPSAHMTVYLEVGILLTTLYLKAIQDDKLPNEIETLSEADRYNEYVMTGLRTIWGVSLDRIKENLDRRI